MNIKRKAVSKCIHGKKLFRQAMGGFTTDVIVTMTFNHQDSVGKTIIQHICLKRRSDE